MMNETELRSELVRIAGKLDAQGLNRGTSGNLSARYGEGMLITPSGMGAEGLTEDDIAKQRTDDSFRELMRFQIDRARAYYSLAEPGIAALPEDGSRFCARLMSTVYGAILDEIERADYQVYRGRVRVSFLRKLWLALTRW